jgi:hypothetical protein
MKKLLFLSLSIFLIISCQVNFEETKDTEQTSFSFENTANSFAKYDIELALGKLEISATTNNLVEAICKYNMPEMKPDLEVSEQEEKDIIHIGYLDSVSSKSIKKALSLWNMKINPKKKTQIEIESGMLDMDLDLKGSNVDLLKIEGGTIRGEILTGDFSKNQEINIMSGISKVTIYIPESLPTEIKMTGGLTTFNNETKSKFEKKESDSDEKFYKNFLGEKPNLKINLEGGIIRLTIKTLSQKNKENPNVIRIESV